MLKGSAGIIMIILIVASLFVPVDIPYAFDSTAKVYPLQQWVIHKQTDGSLISTLHNYKSGLLKDYSSYQFDRGDVVNIQFNPNQIDQNKIDSGQLIATIQSNMLSGRLIELENEKAIEQANLKRNEAGSKPEIIKQAKIELRLAKQELEIQKLKIKRARGLLNEGLIARAQYEDTENLFKQAQNKLSVAKEKIQVATSGDKPEEIDYIKSRIGSIGKEIDFLANTSQNFAIHSPIAGKISYETGIDGDRLIVEDTTEHILIIPIKLRDRDFIGPETIIEVTVMGQDTMVPARLISVNKKVEIINRNVVVLAKASVSGDIPGLASGMPIKCKVTCGSVKPLEYMKRSTNLELK